MFLDWVRPHSMWQNLSALKNYAGDYCPQHTSCEEVEGIGISPCPSIKQCNHHRLIKGSKRTSALRFATNRKMLNPLTNSVKDVFDLHNYNCLVNCSV